MGFFTAVAKPEALLWLALLVITRYLYRLFLHPLARVPGPKLAALTRRWQLSKISSHKQFLQELHDRYGPVVRIGPNQVSVNSEQAFQAIYNAGKAHEKSDWYNVASNGHSISTLLGFSERPDGLDLFSETDMQKYHTQTDLLRDVYSVSNIKRYEYKITQVMDRVCDRISQLEGREVPLMEWMHIIILECLGAITFSQSPPKCLQEGTDFGVIEGALWGRWKWWTALGLYPKLAVLSQIFPSLMPFTSVFLGVSAPKEKSPLPLVPWVMSQIEATVKNANVVDKGQLEDNLLSQLINTHQTNPALKLVYAKHISRTNFLAGQLTMTASLTGCFAEIASHPDVQRRVESECRGGLAFALDDQNKNTLTNAAIKEALRLHAGTGSNLDRKVPSGGLTVDGYNLPAGTIVGSSVAILHGNTAVFGNDAAEFVPERWLSKDKTRVSKLETVNLVWGEPDRICPGQHLASLIVGGIVPRLFRDFDVKVCGPEDGPNNAPPFFTTSIHGFNVKFRKRTDKN